MPLSIDPIFWTIFIIVFYVIMKRGLWCIEQLEVHHKKRKEEIRRANPTAYTGDHYNSRNRKF